MIILFILYMLGGRVALSGFCEGRIETTNDYLLFSVYISLVGFDTLAKNARYSTNGVLSPLTFGTRS